MKAIINGIEIEGTPSEIVEFRNTLRRSDDEFTKEVINIVASEKELFKKFVDRVAEDLNREILDSLKRIKI